MYIQNSAARLITGTKKYSPITLVLQQLHTCKKFRSSQKNLLECPVLGTRLYGERAFFLWAVAVEQRGQLCH